MGVRVSCGVMCGYPHPASAISNPVCSAPPSGHARDPLRHGSGVPATDSCAAANSIIIDHVVGADKQSWRDGDAERSCRVEVYHKFKFRWLLDGQVPGRCAIKDLSNIPRRTGPQFHNVDRVGHETAGFDILAERVNCRQSTLLSQLDDQSSVHPAFRFGTHKERVGAFLCHHLEHTSILCLLKGAFQPGASSKRPSL